MFIDLTMTITPAVMSKVGADPENTKLLGHIGTHFDTMDKEFPLSYFRLPGTLFDLRCVTGRDIEISDVDLSQIQPDSCVIFYTGFSEKEEYGSPVYFKEHPQLNAELISALTSKRVRIIAIDFAGVRRGKEHTPMDQYCADQGTFIVENLSGIAPLNAARPEEFTVYTFPLKITGLTGVPCRIAAELKLPEGSV